MKVLILSVFHPELVRGGAQQVAWELFEGLKSCPGVRPVLLAGVAPSDAALFKVGAGITGFDGRADEYLFLGGDYDSWWHKLANPRPVQAYAEFLDLVRPDVVHFHHFMPFGIDLLSLTRRMLPDARIVLTLHEFLAICTADGHMVRRTDATLCERASPVRCHQCFPDLAPERFLLREHWFKAHFSVVDVFTTPSRFMQAQFIAWGLPKAKLAHVANAQRDLNPARAPPEPGRKRNRFGFFGQMVDAKGVWLLLDAVARLRAEGFSDFSVEINGDNLRYASDHRRAEIAAFMAAEAALPYAERRVTFNGAYPQEQVGRRMARIDWCVIPSVWWEAFGLVLSEAWMFGRPAIAPDIGGPAERITSERDGLLFAFADAGSLAQCMHRAATEAGLWDRLAAAIAPPPPRETMVQQFLALYRAA